MKKLLRSVLLGIAAAIMLFAVVGCSNANKEVAGTYEMDTISGTMGGIEIDKSYYEYFRLILDEDGTGTVQAKGSGVGGVSVETKGTYVYEDGKIKLTTKNGAMSTTEEYDYADGVITYHMEAQGVNFTITLKRVEE